jgi:hypothetical protein
MKMSKADNIAAQERLADNVNSGDVATAVESFAEGCLDHDPAPGQEPVVKASSRSSTP